MRCETNASPASNSTSATPGAAGACVLSSDDPPSNHVRGAWAAKRCYGTCPAGTMDLLEGFKLQIDESRSPRQQGSPAPSRSRRTKSRSCCGYTDDGSTELMRVLSHDESVGKFDHDGSKYSVAFPRVAD